VQLAVIDVVAGEAERDVDLRTERVAFTGRVVEANWGRGLGHERRDGIAARRS